MSNATVHQHPAAQNEKRKLLTRFAERFEIEEKVLLDTLKTTVFKQRDGSAPTNEQMVMLMIVADQYQLNPFTKEIYAFPDQQNGIVPVVGVDGWARIINNHPQYAGMEFVYSDEMVKMPGAKVDGHVWIECVMYRKDIDRPIRVREYLDEVYREPFVKNGYTKIGPWQTHIKRFHRHKAMIQCSRLAFGFTGIYDNDEAERIVGGEVDVTQQGSHSFQRPQGSEQDEAPLRELTDPEKAAIEPMLQKAIQRSQQLNNWTPAEQWVRESFPSAEQKAYALSRLEQAKAATEADASPEEPQDATAPQGSATPEQQAAPAEPAKHHAPGHDEFPRPEDRFDDEDGVGF